MTLYKQTIDCVIFKTLHYANVSSGNSKVTSVWSQDRSFIVLCVSHVKWFHLYFTHEYSFFCSGMSRCHLLFLRGWKHDTGFQGNTPDTYWSSPAQCVPHGNTDIIQPAYADHTKWGTILSTEWQWTQYSARFATVLLIIVILQQLTENNGTACFTQDISLSTMSESDASNAESSSACSETMSKRCWRPITVFILGTDFSISIMYVNSSLVTSCRTCNTYCKYKLREF